MKWKISYGTIIPLRAPRVKKIFYFCAKARQKAFFRAGFGQIQGFSDTFGIVFILLACYNLVTVTQNAGAATSAAALVVAAICAMACAHCLAEVVSYSVGRVVYYTDGRIFAPFAAALAVQFFMNLLEKFRPAENKEINYDNAETLD